MIWAPIVLVGFFVALRLNSLWERNVEARRILHAVTLPLYHYLGLMDQELQSSGADVNGLFRQAVLDHVTEMRAFLLQPTSKDLEIFRSLKWVNQLNNLLLAMEDALETETGEIDITELKAQVAHLLRFIRENSYLSGLIGKPLGIVRYSES